MEFIILQHREYLPAGLLGWVLAQRVRPTRVVRLWEGEAVPGSPDGVRALVVLAGDVLGGDRLGGDAAVEQAQRDAERRLLAACVNAGVPVLGVSLGARLLAEATGGRVEPDPDAASLGYVPVARTEDGALDAVFGAYPDGMAVLRLDPDRVIPGPDAVPLACSPTGVEAFRIGDAAYGIGFHPELDAGLVAGCVAVSAVRTRLEAAGCEPDELVIQARRRDVFHKGMGAALLGRWVDAVVGRLEEETPWGRRGPAPVPAPGLSLHPA